jgi:hypothetical protein
MIMTKEKVAAIKKKLQNGEPEGEIREQLKKEGFTDEEISKAFVPHQFDMRLWYLVFGVLVSVYGLYKLITAGDFIILACGAGLFYAYYAETKRLQK